MLISFSCSFGLSGDTRVTYSSISAIYSFLFWFAHRLLNILRKDSFFPISPEFWLVTISSSSASGSDGLQALLSLSSFSSSSYFSSSTGSLSSSSDFYGAYLVRYSISFKRFILSSSLTCSPILYRPQNRCFWISSKSVDPATFIFPVSYIHFEASIIALAYS